MPGASPRTYFVLTPKGDRGPLDRGELRELLQQHEIEAGQYVRNAFGRSLGTVADVLGQRSVSSGPRTPIATAPVVPEKRPVPVGLIAIGSALLLLAVILAMMRGGGDTYVPPSPPPAQVPEPPPAPASPNVPPPPALPAAAPGAANPGAPGRPPDASLLPGLIAEFHNVASDPADMPDFSCLTPILRRIEHGFDVGGTRTWPGTKLATRFCMRASGVLRTTAAGRHAFFLTSDDSSLLLIDGRTVVNNLGLHQTKERSGSVDLLPGDHDIVLMFGQGGGGFTCRLWWQPPGGARAILRAPALLHRPDQSLDQGVR